MLFETANKALSQIMGIMALLMFIVLMFALFLFEVEKGTPCFVGDSDCRLPEDVVFTYKTGQRVLLNKLGDISGFTTVLDSLWFSIVTLTSVGYGDLDPKTNLGQLFSIVLMLFGAIYLAMPLTVAAATFWSVHQAYTEGKKKTFKKTKIAGISFCRKIASLEASLSIAAKYTQEYFDDIQSPVSEEKCEGKLSLYQRCVQVEKILKSTLTAYQSEIHKLGVFALSLKKEYVKKNTKQ